MQGLSQNNAAFRCQHYGDVVPYVWNAPLHQYGTLRSTSMERSAPPVWNAPLHQYGTLCSTSMEHSAPPVWNTLLHQYGTLCSTSMEHSAPPVWNTPLHQYGTLRSTSMEHSAPYWCNTDRCIRMQLSRSALHTVLSGMQGGLEQVLISTVRCVTAGNAARSCL